MISMKDGFVVAGTVVLAHLKPIKFSLVARPNPAEERPVKSTPLGTKVAPSSAKRSNFVL